MEQPTNPLERCWLCEHSNDAREEYDYCSEGHVLFLAEPCDDWKEWMAAMRKTGGEG